MQPCSQPYFGRHFIPSFLILHGLFDVSFVLGRICRLYCLWFFSDWALGQFSLLYAGWIRVLSGYRFGHRVPIDGGDGLPKERFVGHYPNGLDMFLPVEQGVQELHMSVFLNDSGEYILRGLGQQRIQVKRSLEWVQLHYDPNLPAPYESNLSSGDRIQIGNDAEIEFVILPREER